MPVASRGRRWRRRLIETEVPRGVRRTGDVRDDRSIRPPLIELAAVPLPPPRVTVKITRKSSDRIVPLASSTSPTAAATAAPSRSASGTSKGTVGVRRRVSGAGRGEDDRAAGEGRQSSRPPYCVPAVVPSVQEVSAAIPELFVVTVDR